MAYTLLDDPNDTGDIPPIDDLGIEATRDLSNRLRRRNTTSEHTQNLAHEIAGLPPRRRPASDQTAKTRLIDMPIGMKPGAAQPRVIEMDETVLFGLAGPQKPPPPLPKPKDPAETGVNIFGGLGEDLPESLPKPGNYVGRHRHPDDLDEAEVGRYWEMQRPVYERRLSPWWALAGLVVAGLAIWAGLYLGGAAIISAVFR